jgi:CubicO group peptidase (beta-lactamase class C family)
LHQGALKRLNQKALSYFPDYMPLEPSDPRKDQITVGHLHEMRSGINAADDETDSPGSENRMSRTDDWIRFALNVPMAEKPGQVWRYAGLNTMLLGDVVQRATKITLSEYLETRLLQPLGITDYDWKKSPKGRASGQGLLSLRPGDMLKIGLLFLQMGKSNGQQLVPRNWVIEATRVHTPLKYRLYHPSFGGSGVIFSPEVEDVDAAYDAAQQNSLDIVLTLRSEDWGQRHFCLKDPNGVYLDIVQAIEATDEYQEGYTDR